MGKQKQNAEQKKINSALYRAAKRKSIQNARNNKSTSSPIGFWDGIGGLFSASKAKENKAVNNGNRNGKKAVALQKEIARKKRNYGI